MTRANNIIVAFLCDSKGDHADCKHNEAAETSARGCLHRKEFLCSSKTAQIEALKQKLGSLTGKVWKMTPDTYVEQPSSRRISERSSYKKGEKDEEK